MRTSLCLLLLSFGALPLAAQPERRPRQMRPDFPPEIISPEELPRDIVHAASARHVRVDFENDRRRVLRLTLAAGETIPTHDDRSGVLVCLAGCRVRFSMPGGDTLDVELKAGETRWMPDTRRAAHNLAAGPPVNIKRNFLRKQSLETKTPLIPWREVKNSLQCLKMPFISLVGLLYPLPVCLLTTKRTNRSFQQNLYR